MRILKRVAHKTSHGHVRVRLNLSENASHVTFPTENDH